MKQHLGRWYVYLPVSIVLVVVVFARTQPWLAVDRLNQMPPWVPIAVLLLDLALIVVWADRSAALLAGVGRPLSRRSLLPIVVFANTVNNLTPASTGEALRAIVLRDRHGIPMRQSASVILMERVYALYLIGTTAAGLALVEVVQKPIFVATAYAILLFLAFLPNLAYELLHVRPLALSGRVLQRFAPGPRSDRLASILADVDTHLDALMTHPRHAFGFTARTFLIFAIYGIQLSLILSGLGHPIMPWTAWAAYGLAMVAGVISSLPFGLGATDAVLAILLVGWGVPSDIAALSTILLRLLQTLPMSLMGVASYVYLSRTGPPPRPAPGKVEGTTLEDDGEASGALT